MPSVDECLRSVYDSFNRLAQEKAFHDIDKSSIADDKNPFPVAGFSKNHPSFESFAFTFKLIYPLIEARLQNPAELEEFLEKHVKEEFREEVKKDFFIINAVIKVLKRKNK